MFPLITILFLILNFSVHSSYIIGSIQGAVFTEQAGAGLPIRLEIPSIKVDAAIEYVGITSQGLVAVPEGGINVAWFNLGPRPGDIGTAIMVGHYGPWKNGQGSVFDNLNKSKQGDKLYIRNEKGMTITFVVREIRIYDQNAGAKDVFISSDGRAHLNLITCEGIWDDVKKTYSNRLVVFTDKE